MALHRFISAEAAVAAGLWGGCVRGVVDRMSF